MTADRSGVFRWAAYSQGAQLIINFSASVYVARLLGPAELGIYSIAIAAIIIAQVLRLAGINAFLIQEKDLTRDKVASAFGLACGFAILLGLGIIASRHHVADFYSHAKIADVLLIAGVSYFFAPLQIIGIGIRTRNLEMAHLTFGAIAFTVGSAATGVLLVLAGHGAISLAWGELVGSLLSSAIYWWRPPVIMRTLPAFRGWWAIWRVSGWSLGASLASQFGARGNELVIGRTMGIADAALLDRGEMVPRLVWNYVAPPVLNLLVPIMASDLRAGHDVAKLTGARLRLFACIFGPALVALGTQSSPLLLTLYGEAWAASIVPARWLCVAAAIIGQFVVLSSVLAAMGRTRDQFWIVAAEQMARLVILLMLGWSGINIVAMGMVGVSLAYAVAATLIARRAGVITIAELLINLRPGLILCAIVFVAGEASLVAASSLGLNQGLTLLMGTIVTAATGFAALRIVEPDVMRSILSVLLKR